MSIHSRNARALRRRMAQGHGACETVVTVTAWTDLEYRGHLITYLAGPDPIHGGADRDGYYVRGVGLGPFVDIEAAKRAVDVLAVAPHPRLADGSEDLHRPDMYTRAHWGEVYARAYEAADAC